jgi:hypothetical protein
VTIGVIYGSVSISGQEGQGLLQKAVGLLLESFADSGDEPTVLWRLCFTQIGSLDLTDSVDKIHRSSTSDQVLFFPPPSLDLAFDDEVVESVRAGWKAVAGDEAHDDNDFMKFEDREDYDDD